MVKTINFFFGTGSGEVWTREPPRKYATENFDKKRKRLSPEIPVKSHPPHKQRR